MKEQTLRGSLIVVTGAASGIGLAISVLAYARGARLALLDINEKGLEDVRERVSADDNSCRSYPVDVSREKDVERAFEQAQRDLGQIWGLVTSAGTSRAQRVEQIPMETWDLLIDVNVNGLFYCCQAAAKAMIPYRGGSMVNIGSISGLGGQAARAAYSATKSAVHNLTRALAMEWGPLGIRVNCVAPGLVETPLIRQSLPRDQMENVICARTPLGQAAEADQVARAAMFLLSGEASFINGQIIAVDGGLTAGRLQGEVESNAQGPSL